MFLRLKTAALVVTTALASLSAGMPPIALAAGPSTTPAEAGTPRSLAADDPAPAVESSTGAAALVSNIRLSAPAPAAPAIFDDPFFFDP